jgi:alkanesulfonate monooxygenase SsuD/methylene tetrahydromethanopterin reductase-like flavin-dependent oxidoreductase (luciferase family)
MFEPKPIQKPWPKIHVGGESPAALRRAAAHADGWFGLVHTPQSAGERVAELQRLRSEAGLSEAKVEVTLSVTPGNRDEVRRFADAGVDRLVVSPWRRSRECVPALRGFAEIVFDHAGC